MTLNSRSSRDGLLNEMSTVLNEMSCSKCGILYDSDERCPVKYNACSHMICSTCVDHSCMDRCPICNKSPVAELSDRWNRVVGIFKEKKEGVKVFNRMESNKVEVETHVEKLLLEKKIRELDIVAQAEKIKNGCFACSECAFLVAEYRAHICVECGVSNGYIDNQSGVMRLKGDTYKIENGKLLCLGCAVEGCHAGHQTTNYQKFKLAPLSMEKMLTRDVELASKRDTLVNSQTRVAVARLLQTARVELSKLSDESVNAISWEEYSMTWNALDAELSRVHKLTENLLRISEETEKSLQNVVAGISAIRAGCKVFTRSTGKPNTWNGLSLERNFVEKTIVQDDEGPEGSVVTEACSEWEGLSEFSEKAVLNFDESTDASRL